MSAGWLLPDAVATERFGAALGLSCPWSDSDPCVLYLRGALGAGKTSMAAAALAALGVREAVRSPSYALMEIYPLDSAQAVHLDLYRLIDAEDLETLGLRDYLNARTLLLIEWPERAAQALPRADLELQLSLQDPGRRCEARTASAVGGHWLRRLQARLESQS
jgi:tRNA threonylcarbamoyladenosine biosynthesis protein TsaE